MRKLKITMGIFGAIVAIEGILNVAFPTQRAAGMGLGSCAPQAALPVMVLGATWAVLGTWLIVAARNPLQHLSWVKCGTTLQLALILALVLAAWRGSVAIHQVFVELALNALFAALLLAFYPRGAAACAP